MTGYFRGKFPDCYKKNVKKVQQSGNISGFSSVFSRFFFRKFAKKSQNVTGFGSEHCITTTLSQSMFWNKI